MGTLWFCTKVPRRIQSQSHIARNKTWEKHLRAERLASQICRCSYEKRAAQPAGRQEHCHVCIV